ncbi:MAG: IclR family transcriptional regulator [Sporomusaceae bacterium]|nr:IclR family transcriptional regulator [Sporomusaceae bacterium]
MASVRSNKSAARVVDILVLLAKSSRSLTLAEIARELQIPKSSAFDLVYTLVEKGFLELDEQNGAAFTLGLKVFEVGAAFLSKADLHRAARARLEYLVAATGRTAFLATENHGEIVYLDKVEPHSAIFTGALLGSRNPMSCTGLGKALLAAWPQEKVEALLREKGLACKTAFSITEPQRLFAELSLIKQRGYALDERENETDIFCVAAPIFDRRDRAVAAISIANPASSMDEAAIKIQGTLMVESALAISRQLGFLRQKLYEL